MKLCATLTKDDLASVIEEITPLRVEIRPRRVISLGRPSRVELVAGAGLRVRGDARFTWDVGGVTIPVTLRAWQVLLVPSFVARGGGHVLAFDPVLEELDFKRVPLFLDGKIADAVKQGLAAQKSKVAWNFAKHLSVVRPMPARVTPGGTVSLAPSGGNVTVTATEMQLTLTFELRLDREPVPASLRAFDNDPPSSRTLSAR